MNDEKIIDSKSKDYISISDESKITQKVTKESGTAPLKEDDQEISNLPCGKKIPAI